MRGAARTRLRPRDAALALAVSLAAMVSGGAAAPGTDRDAGGITEGRSGFLVTPRRIVFEDRRRSASLSLINSGMDTTTFRISLVRMRMSETGQITVVDTAHADEAFAEDLVRFSPRQVELAPREAQVIRLQVRKPADLAAGEYRSHLLVQSIPRTRATGEDDPAAGGRAAGVQVRIVPVFGTAVPVIVRHGETAAEVAFSDVRFRPGAPGEPATATFVIRRQGNRSVYGDLTLVHAPERGPEQVLGVMKGVSVYTPNRSRTLSVPLDSTVTRLPSGGRLRLRYTDSEPDGRTIAEANLQVP